MFAAHTLSRAYPICALLQLSSHAFVGGNCWRRILRTSRRDAVASAAAAETHERTVSRREVETGLHVAHTHTHKYLLSPKKGQKCCTLFLWQKGKLKEKGKKFRTRRVQSISGMRSVRVCVCLGVRVSGCVRILAVIIAFLCMRAYCECPWPW